MLLLFNACFFKEDVYYPPVDLVEMFLTLADKPRHGFLFWYVRFREVLGRKDYFVERNRFEHASDTDEVWKKYGHHKSFQGWYLSQEISRRTKNMSKIYAEVGKHAKSVSAI
ncbi:DUF4434 domain-containing protein [Bacteroides thetaiotaomicron]|nr:DUF4434 domain-containing protein [Bacteroides thetaiotaomicron]